MEHPCPWTCSRPAQTSGLPSRKQTDRHTRFLDQSPPIVNCSAAANRIQLTSDGFRPYKDAVDDAFGMDVDFAMLVKMYSSSGQADTRYSPGEIVDARPIPITGNPKPRLISTSHIERQNLTIRMQLRRFTRLTNAFSKKLDNLKAALSLHFAYYNFCRIHQTLRVTPCMEAEVTDHGMTIRELLSA